MLQVSEGAVLLSGISTVSRQCKSRIGYMQSEVDFYKKEAFHYIALIGNPKLILMDEPANGVDTYGILQLKDGMISQDLYLSEREIDLESMYEKVYITINSTLNRKNL